MGDNFNRRILIIDDNRLIHEDFRKILTIAPASVGYGKLSAELFGDEVEKCRFAGFELDFACQGQEGLEKVQHAVAVDRPYGVAFVDVRMPPGWDGIETTARLWEISPELQVVICTAYSDYDWSDIARKLGHTDHVLILKKPFDTIEVLQMAETLARKWTLARQARLRLADLDAVIKQRTEELRQSQKLEALGQLAGGVAHDFNNLLTVIRGNADLTRRHLQGCSEEVAGWLEEICAASDRAANLTRQLLAFSRKQIMQPRPLDLDRVILNLSKMLKRIIGENIDLKCRYDPALPMVQADISMLEQALVNLVVNARDAMPGGGQLLITTEKLTFPEASAPAHPEARPGDFVCITVKDTGSGIAPEHLPHIFEPFFTTKDVGKGTGLGLATVYGIVKQHEGWIEVSSQVGCGSTFRLFLQALPSLQPEEAKEKADANEMPRGKETILLVEDDEAVRKVTRIILERSGYNVLEAGSGPAALQAWETAAAKVDLLLTDVIMPEGITGRELAERLRAQKASLKVIYQSGYSAEIIGTDGEFLSRTKSFLLQKPCLSQDLLRTVRRCLDGLGADCAQVPLGLEASPASC